MTVPGFPPLLEAVPGVGADLDLRGTLQRIVDGAAELTGARYAALGTTDPGQDGLTEISTPGAPPRPPNPLRVPIPVHDEIFGHLYLAGKRNDAPFTAEDEKILRILAAQAGIAIGNARLYPAAPTSPTSTSPSTRRRRCQTPARRYA